MASQGVHYVLALVLCLLGSAGLSGCAYVEKFFTISTINLDPTCTGTLRETVVVNGVWPGPTIYAEDGDTILIHIINRQPLPVTIHIHGLAQQDAQWWDGVPMITQCPVKMNKNFTLVVPIRGQWGTFWYHAHTNQMRHTVSGAVIVRPPKDSNPEPLPVPIYGEMLMLGGDWYRETAAQLDSTILTAPYPGYPPPQALHLNGATLCSGPKVFTVRRKKWYRLRIINQALWASFNLRIEGHTMILHEADGGYLLHQPVDMLDVYPGQTYSVLIYTNQRANNYWIVLNSRYDVEKAVQLPAAGVLAYAGSGLGPLPPNNRPFPKGPTGPNRAQFGVQQQQKLLSPYYNQELSFATINKLVVLEMNQNTMSSGKQVFSMNNVSFTYANVPFLYADYTNTSSSTYTTLPNLPPKGLPVQKDGPTKFAPYVVPIPYGAWVQLVFQNHLPPGGLHPFHLHGQNFYVVGQGNGTFNPQRWKRYSYNLINPPLRNTVGLFDSGWTAVRFRATNPGTWIVHCHLEQHADQGLLAILKVQWPASDGTKNGPKPLGPPPDDYPSCT